MLTVTCDKSTPSRTTNQAVLLLARCDNGQAVAIPAGAPAVYDETMVADGEALARRLLETLKVGLDLH
jgi:hypothetical protein